jgi:hypothetical protein
VIKTFFFKNSKKTWLGKVGTNKKWLVILISKHLVAVNLCGLQAKEPDFHVSDLKTYTIHAFFGPIGRFKNIYNTCFFWAETNERWPAKIAAGMLTPGKWGPLKFTLPPHGLPLTLITHFSAFPASNQMVS